MGRGKGKKNKSDDDIAGKETNTEILKEPMTTKGDEFDNSFSLEMIYTQMKLQREELLERIGLAQEQIIIQMQSENTSLKEEIKKLQTEMEDKNKKITEIQTEIVTLKEEVAKGMSICHKQRTDLTAVERELIDLQQYVRRNNVEICNLPESIKDDDLESTVIDIGK